MHLYCSKCSKKINVVQTIWMHWVIEHNLKGKTNEGN